jgi:hypothetical protein
MHNCPKKLFIDYLVPFISQLRAKEHKVVLAVDINENSIEDRLNKALHQVRLLETSYRKFNRKRLASCSRGSE